MNKVFVFFVLLIPLFYFGQSVKIEPYNTGWLPVDSYQGARASNLIQVPIQLNSPQGQQMNEWSLHFRVVGPISNDTKTLSASDVGKLKFQISNVTSSSANDDGILANLNNIGANTWLIPFSTGSTAIVPYSNYSLQVVNRYLVLTLALDVEMEGGAFLEQYSSWSNYTVNMVFELRNRKGQLMPNGQPSQNVSFQMRIRPSDTPPVEQNYVLALNPNASSVLLEFKTPADYANGVTEVQPQALSIISKTPYFLQVKTLSSELSSTSSTLPFNSVQLSMKESQSGLTTGSVTLSTTNQTLESSPAHTAIKWYDLTYFIKPPADDYGFFNKPYQLYSGTVLFSITPQ